MVRIANDSLSRPALVAAEQAATIKRVAQAVLFKVDWMASSILATRGAVVERTIGRINRAMGRWEWDALAVSEVFPEEGSLQEITRQHARIRQGN